MRLGLSEGCFNNVGRHAISWTPYLLLLINMPQHAYQLNRMRGEQKVTEECSLLTTFLVIRALIKYNIMCVMAWYCETCCNTHVTFLNMENKSLIGIHNVDAMELERLGWVNSFSAARCTVDIRWNLVWLATNRTDDLPTDAASVGDDAPRTASVALTTLPQ